MKPLAPNTTLQNRYQVSRLIGKGGMGEVYLAVDTRLGHSVALKRTTVGDDAVLGEAFEQEARTLASLRHPVLPKVSDHFIESGEQFLVMDYIEGEDLSKRLRTTKKPFPLNWVLFWADQLLEALEYLHKHRPPIIHRDIKPQNLKLTPENQIILLDFGLSKRSVGETKVTSSGSVVGYTPHYAPMEQIRGTGTNAQSDIYSLSATLYQLLTAVVPADSLSRADSMIGGDEDPLRPLTELNSEISEELSAIILKGMTISQDKRYPSARDMQKELRKAFNALQASMSAETVAFNIGDDVIAGDVPKTEVDANLDKVGIIDKTAPDVPAYVPIAGEGDFSADKTEVMDLSDLMGASDEPVQPEAPAEIPQDTGTEEQFGLKTEAFVASDLVDDNTNPGFQETVQFDAVSSEPNYDDDYDVPESNEDADDEADQEANFSPDATVPLISFDDPGSVGDANQSFGDSDDVVPDADDSGATSVNADHASTNYSDGDSDDMPGAVAADADTEKKSSTGKYIAVLGGLGALLLLLLVSALAIGWYMTNQSPITPNDNANISTATPEATVEQTPEEDPTPANTNEDVLVGDGNSNTADESNSNTSESNSGRTESSDTRNTPGTGKTNPTPRQTRTPATARTPKPAATARPTAVVTPKPAPTKKPTTKDPGILQ